MWPRCTFQHGSRSLNGLQILQIGNITQNFNAVLVLQTCMGLIRPMQDKAYKMYNAGAYLHQYKQFGIDKQDFDSCFARIEDTYASYQAL